MYCKNCGNQMDDLAAICVKCGVAKGIGNAYCPNCGAQTIPGANACTNCGFMLQAPVQEVSTRSKIAAGLLGIFLGGWGVHNFYLGKTGRGVAQIIVTFVTCGAGSIWGLVEGIMILCGAINTDADGKTLSN